MSKLQTGAVIFRRIRGRIIPILKKEKGTIGASLGLGTFGLGIGGSIGSAVLTKEDVKKSKRFAALMKKSEKSDTKKFVASSGIKTDVFTNEKDILKSKSLSVKEKKFFRFFGHASGTFQGRNAFVAKIRGKNYLVSGEKTNKAVIGHELGHIKDYQKHGTQRGFFDRGIMGNISGNVVAREKRAWSYSPVIKLSSTEKSIKKAALEGYETKQRRTRIGGAIGTALGIGYAIGVRKITGL